MNMNNIALVPLAFLAGCFTLSQSEYPQVAMTTVPPVRSTEAIWPMISVVKPITSVRVILSPLTSMLAT